MTQDEEADPLLSTHELKGRGWTPSLIRDFLGPHDATRPNRMRLGGRRTLPHVKLYLTERVNEAESEERFLIAQGRAMDARERAERARNTRRAKRLAQVEALLSDWPPKIAPVQIRRGARRKAYVAHQDLLLDAQSRVNAALPNLPRAERAAVEARLETLYWAALEAAYPWLMKREIIPDHT